MVNTELKQLIDITLGVGPMIDNALRKEDIDWDVDTKEVMAIELLKFLLFLGKSDGEVSFIERDFINTYLSTYLGAYITDDFIERFISQQNIDKAEFKTSIPESFKITCMVDKAIFQADNNQDNFNGSQLQYNIYEVIGREFIACDSNITENEVKNYTDYLSLLKNFRESEISACKDVNVSNNINLNNGVEENNVTIDDLLDNLNKLVGLKEVKQDVNSLINLLKIRKIREERGLKQPPMSLHLVFSGNPGTGKTTVARLLSQIYCKLGILSKGHLTEVDRSGLVGGYIGQTAIKVKEVIEKAKGGVLFIDEAYSLTYNKGENDYGIEAVDTLIKAMEDNRDDLIVIVAGYPKLMDKFLQSNPGLRSRFNKFINFSDYNADELLEIYDKMCKSNSLVLTEEAKNYVYDYFTKRCLYKNANFANARDVRNFFEQTLVKQANRLSYSSSISDLDLSKILVEDVCNIEI